MKHKKNTAFTRALIIGAGVAGRELYTSLRTTLPRFHVIGFIDDIAVKHAQRRGFPPILGKILDITTVSAKNHVEIAMIAIPSADGAVIRRIIDQCAQARIAYKIVPRTADIIEGRASASQLREVQPEDILGRSLRRAEQKGITSLIRNKTILVTGGAGSIGSELCRQIATMRPRKLIILDWWENGCFTLDRELRARHKRLALEIAIGNIQNRKRVQEIFQTHKPQLVFHAAAYKHVPLMEAHPQEAIRNNVLGSWNVLQAAAKYKAQRCIVISTDKAVNPTNIMGATKRMTELLMLSMQHSKTRFAAVRFGNVIASNGSAIPIFLEQIKNGGPVTVTDRRMTRFFMSIPEAVQLILEAAQCAKGGEVFVLDMGEPINITSLAYHLIRLAGFVPQKDIKVAYIGMRPGEKLYEETLSKVEGAQATKQKGIFVARPQHVRATTRRQLLLDAETTCKCHAVTTIEKFVRRYVPEYSNSKKSHA